MCPEFNKFGTEVKYDKTLKIDCQTTAAISYPVNLGECILKNIRDNVHKNQSISKAGTPFSSQNDLITRQG